jgi:sugar-phosphatase
VPDVLVAAEDVSRGKPAPDGYIIAAERLGVDAKSCVVIEDTPAGVAAGRAAGALTIGVATTFPSADLGKANVVIATLAAVTASVHGGDIHLTIR